MIRNFFADSDFLTGLMVDRDSRSQKSNEIFEHLKESSLISDISNFHVSNYIIMEVVQNLIGKHMPFAQVRENYDNLTQCHVFQIKPKHIEEAFNTKLAPFCNHHTGNSPIGIVDATSLVVMDKSRINHIISFDEGFDKLPAKLFTRINDNDVIDQRILSRQL
ncbi:MAG: PIN domain-containing protein [Methanotrichaceae archaeon]|jgi:predicted nucleic acid-binding protein